MSHARIIWGRLRPVLLSTALVLCPLGAMVSLSANDGVDTIVTGSVKAEAVNIEDTAATRPVGSQAFKTALEKLVSGNPVDAYDLARALPSDLERRTIQWAAIYFNAGAIDYDSIKRFAADAPGFATGQRYTARLELALANAAPASDEVIAHFSASAPTTITGKIALAKAHMAKGETEKATALARQVWTENFLDRGTEAQVQKTFASLLDGEAHWARAVHLMMHDRASAVERLLPKLSDAQKSLATARIAVSRKAGNAKALLDKVDTEFQNHPVYLFSRAQRARQAGLYESALDWLNKVKAPLPDGDEWWYERRTVVRALLYRGDASLAYKAASTFTEGPEGRLVEARFHAGWIALAFLGDAAAAKTHFEAMREVSTLPDSVTQANYWLGRTLLSLGDQAGARAAFTAAAEHGTVYYGLLARAELGLKGAELRETPAWEGRQSAFNNNDVVRAVRLLVESDRKTWAVALLRNFAYGLQDGADLMLAARLSEELEAHHLSILIADIAEKRGTPLDPFSFPKDGLPSNARLASVDKAAVYAITRQESNFQPEAMSGVGARGLMQLMPATAKETAGKLGLEYSKSRLTSDPAYNALLGSTYLARQLQHYEGSLVLAAAAYNAGGGNANKWIRAYGDPRAVNVDPVVWVELIPFQETRKYVQRVLGNYLVYRARFGGEPMSFKQALRRIH